MKLTKTKPNWLLTLILTFHIISAQIEASHDDDDVRILIVGIRGDSRFSAADILSGRTDGGQEDREIVKTPVITDEGRRMMLVTGPNLCEDRGIAGEMIDACGGRFHMIRDSEPDQTAALVVEIDKPVWLNGDGFYLQELKTEEMSEDVHEENQLLSIIYDASGGAAGIVAWIFLISLTALVVYIEGGDKILIFRAAFTLPALFMIYLRHFLSPDVAVPLNLALMTSLATVFTIEPILINKFNTSRDTSNSSKYIGAAAIPSFPLIQGSALVLGTLISIRSWSDVLIACHAAPGVTAGAYAFIFQHEKISRDSPVFVLGSFLCCAVGATLLMGFVNVFALLGMNMTIMLLISVLACWHLKSETLHSVFICSYTVFFMWLCAHWFSLSYFRADDEFS